MFRATTISVCYEVSLDKFDLNVRLTDSIGRHLAVMANMMDSWCSLKQVSLNPIWASERILDVCANEVTVHLQNKQLHVKKKLKRGILSVFVHFTIAKKKALHGDLHFS